MRCLIVREKLRYEAVEVNDAASKNTAPVGANNGGHDDSGEEDDEDEDEDETGGGADEEEEEVAAAPQAAKAAKCAGGKEGKCKAGASRDEL